MGCWNATCNISNLPIFAGEKVVLIPLAKVKDDCEFNVCYPTDVFVPFGLPLFGEYDDYGGIENITTSEYNKKHLIQNFNYFCSCNDGLNTKYEPIEKGKDFEEFVRRVLCERGGIYIKKYSTLHKDGMVEINFIMMHREVYDVLLTEVATRKPYNKEDTLQSVFRNKIIEKITETHKQIDNFEKIKEEASVNAVDNQKVFALCDMMAMDVYKELAKETFALGTLNPCVIAWIQMAKELLNVDAVDELIAEAVNLRLFTRALSCLRKGYLCDSGAGSQSEETRMQYLVAKFVIKHIEDLAQTSREDDDCDTFPSFGVEETFYD